MTSRTAMLADIRSNLRKSDAFEHLYHHLQPSRISPRPSMPDVSQEDLADRFCAELAAVGGEIHRVGSEEQAAETIRVIVGDIHAKRVVTSDLELLEKHPDRFTDIELVGQPSREDLFSADAGISGAQLAIAATGTLVLRSSLERHRLVSLIPPIHICVLNTENIRSAMADVLEEMSSEIDPTITFITGPSRTSDIELTLAIGVHGPKRLIVVLID